ncbi:DNA polymerase III subunit epsilon [Haematospirillum jordaniae]|uniref:DNA polymerase III subunit epsilon n=1 Tax=Haematospirillum jordaniae TaxID=1549855 RepID=A0A143DCJ3_9PROT|nr:DNA polymerase III subunit epsilon [Haematospirillum jordaniae]AMW34454.1 DNA polymerase III subunit epsilon [Haematospirillum jordaniae]NKD44557.1 DNA polymerase III subunit epsilon [Haematospirillum jordaniae]NKD57577.1 DNA polymerase III subunit epsilon [Haematospirillum jordaniae]NKD59147.1 DNA polymerase III subunit epsilon [Haematospirillum jordaniae]NKD67285.1 DNA polymerase III subunit epsilon [Haematospirillum jordaniae]
MREVVFDTETTGFDPAEGHRLVEIGCLELVHLVPTGRTFHTYLDPQRDVPADAARVHGLTTEFLSGKPLFAEKAQDFLDFIADSPLVIHNAAFDMKFINAELVAHGFPPVPFERAVDTLLMARRQFPGAPASLDALCKRFNIDNSRRDKHGALLDSELLAEVYLELRGGRQPGLVLSNVPSSGKADGETASPRTYREPRPHAPTPEEAEAHQNFVRNMVKEALWLQYDKS